VLHKTLDTLHPVSTQEVVKLLGAAWSCLENSRADFISTKLLKELSEVLSPVITRLSNFTFETGVFPTEYKLSRITPIRKKTGLKVDEPLNY